jgi:glycosyltransferase involved in cell wall biosynthesis
MNRLYWEKLKQYTSLPFELIIIDNNSTDGSVDFFESVGARVIRNKGNYSYPYCQNQGIEVAKYDILAFFNNDIIVCPQWDKRMLEIMTQENIDFISPATNDRTETTASTKK